MGIILLYRSIHYAGSISRALEFEETPELADFLIESLLRDDGLFHMAGQNIGMGGLGVISKYVTGKEKFDQYVKDIVLSQLNIKN